MKRMMLFLAAMLMAISAFAEEPSPTPESTKRSTSVVEGGYTAPATPAPAPTAELPPLRDDPMLYHAVEIAQRIDILAKNESFRDRFMYGFYHDKLEVLTSGDHTRPQRAYHLNDQALIEGLYSNMPEAERLDFTRPELLRDLVGELPEILWGRREEMELSIFSVLSRCKMFALPGAEGCGLFVFLYKEAVPVIVTWYAENECVETAAFFMPDEALAAAEDAAAVSEWFAVKGMPLVQFEEVPLT